nr:phospholipase D family protein [Ramlibacter rhizophilus]
MLALLTCAAMGSACASLPSDVVRTPSQAWSAPGQTPLGQLTSQRRNAAAARSDSGFHLLDSVDAALTSRLALIESARHTLDLQYYAVHADASTELLLQRIRQAAQRGVRVRLLLDDFNTAGKDAQVLRLGLEPNIAIRLFNPLPGPRSSFVARIVGSLHDMDRIQKRMHNKLFIADNAWGITGGRNLGDAYFGSDEKSNFVDLDVLAAGRIVRDMSASFDRYWNDELAYPMDSLLSPKDLERLREQGLARSAPDAPAGAVLPGVDASEIASVRRAPMDLARVPLVWAPSVLLVDKPGKLSADEEAGAQETVVDGLLGLMREARQEVLIISPYFVPGRQMMDTFAELRARGIAVRVLTNSLASNDAPAAHAGYARYRPDLIALGVQLHEMRADVSAEGASAGSGFGIGGSKGLSSRASLHSKAVLIDRRLNVLGSMNLDLRSQLQNSEVALLIRSTRLAQQGARLIESTIARGAYRVTVEDGVLVWRAPPGAAFGDERTEPLASWSLRLLVKLLGPLAPEEML